MTLSIKDKSDILTSWLSLISVIVGVVAFLISYRAVSDKKVSDTQIESMRLFKLYNTELQANRAAFYQVRRHAGSSVSGSLNAIGNAVGAVQKIEKHQRRAATNYIQANEKENDIDSLIIFFDQVHSCVRVSVCDGKVAEALFSDEAYDLRYFLGDYISAKRIYRPAFGVGLESISRKK